jgi:hypothetical protein
MFALGQKAKYSREQMFSAVPPTADIRRGISKANRFTRTIPARRQPICWRLLAEPPAASPPRHSLAEHLRNQQK